MESQVDFSDEERGLGRCPQNPARAFSPMQPDQRVTLSLETPLMGCTPKNPLRICAESNKQI